ncbi:MAG: diacylglycerol kinase family protein [Patescibacteria group bacterium]|jgi:undecaprenol kinase
MTILNFFKTFYHASRGIFVSIRSERNMRVHIFAATTVLVLATLLDITFPDLLIVVLLIGIVISAEMMNTSIEKVCNILRDKYHLPYEDSRDIRDIAAGGVWVQAIIAAIVGILIFSRYFTQ